MKKVAIYFCLILILILQNALSVAASGFRVPMPFEVFSEDESRVFVFAPSVDVAARWIHYAAVYEIVDNERQLIYVVEGIGSAFEDRLFFSDDMMHFVSVFDRVIRGSEPGFEVFSNGVRTRLVTRSDFIRFYNLRIDPDTARTFFLFTWRIEEHSPADATITIRTGEQRTLVFDFSTAEFISNRFQLSRTVVLSAVVLIAVVLIGIGTFIKCKKTRSVGGD